MYSSDPEFYAFSRTLEVYSEGGNKNSVLLFTTDNDYSIAISSTRFQRRKSAAQL